ncbi:transposase [Erwinia tracheiphila]|uniref:transposase n=2 Tax=Erwinia tracheiphila TaxID=65700 RepID=UPI002E0EA79C|nr:transposase [Erwinia tracheiphila]
MPHLLWPFFSNNRPLLNDLFRCTTRAMLKWVHWQGIEVGIFCALHTDGRQLNQHLHIHVSVTRGGLDVKHDVCSKRRSLRKSGGVQLFACCAAAMRR